MNKREFLKTTGLWAAGTLVWHLDAADTPGGPIHNWAGNLQYSTTHLQKPKSVDEVASIIRGERLRALGTRHSFNNIADSKYNLVSLERFQEMDLDSRAKRVRIGAGVKYGTLAPYLQSKGYALHNLASLPHISAAGACATGTHGSGNRNRNLSNAVAAMEFVDASGRQKTASRDRDGERFQAAVIHLGSLGVVTALTLDVEPTYDVQQVVYEGLSFNHLEHHLDEIFASGYSVSLFTDWQNYRATQVWIKRRVDGGAAKPAPEFFGARLAKRNLHPLADHSAENCTEQMGVPGPWYERLPHFRMNFTPSSGAELQSEFFVPRDRAYEAIRAVETLRDRITPHLFITELRTVDADELWMSPCYQRPSLTIHFTWKPEWPAVKAVLPEIEHQLAPFQARPHWAKLFTMEPGHLQSLYPKLPAFRELVKEHDPTGKFRNEFITRNLFP
jgi:xylitol oxidase